ncbi:MAG: hypothetical protein HLUCCO17_09070 [Saliniramus fredricksonii]|uniref:DUF4760 domain-containing protein n=1 Tax=Saliniramus fredricksonii TaxID=1653334 RepID=A0A0P8A0E5_9HYPH|nr:DUF4760 domain-containing protein [Saliniramus fredricksonii]KPQ10829.1 MAG: hypothetical protein HLUCCO17_09070 [Saliniramus fredricksonii]SCC81055.1 protein of unknown function [Saliniramus fredricksonii]
MQATDKISQVSIHFPIRFSAVAALVLVLLTIVFWAVSGDTIETLVFFAVGAAATAQITTAFFTARLLGFQISTRDAEIEREQRADAREELRKQREEAHDAFLLRREAIRFGERWNHPEMREARATLRSILDKNGDAGALDAYLNENKLDVNHVLNFIEEMATCCRHGLVDEPLMRKQFDYVVCKTWRSLSTWIDGQRKASVDAIWEDMEWLYDQWKTP